MLLLDTRWKSTGAGSNDAHEPSRACQGDLQDWPGGESDAQLRLERFAERGQGA